MAIEREKTDRTHIIVKCKLEDILLEEDAIDGEVYLLKEGMLGLFKKKDDKMLQIGIVKPGSLIGEMHILDGKPQSATVQALSDCILYQLPKDLFSSTFNEQPEWYKTLVKTLVQRIRATTDKQTG